MKQEASGLPDLNALIERSIYKPTLGIGLNEIIVAEGFHPSDYGRNSDRSFGGAYPAKGTAGWEALIAPHRLAAQHRAEQ